MNPWNTPTLSQQPKHSSISNSNGSNVVDVQLPPLLHSDLFTVYCYFAEESIGKIMGVIQNTTTPRNNNDSHTLFNVHREILVTESISNDSTWIVVESNSRIDACDIKGQVDGNHTFPDRNDPFSFTNRMESSDLKSRAEWLVQSTEQFWLTHGLVCQRIVIACHTSALPSRDLHSVKLSYQWLFAPHSNLSPYHKMCLLDFARNHCFNIRQYEIPGNPSYGSPYVIEWQPFTVASVTDLQTTIKIIRTFLDNQFHSGNKLYNHVYHVQVVDRKITQYNQPLALSYLNTLYHPISDHSSGHNLDVFDLPRMQSTSQSTTISSLSSQDLEGPVNVERRSTDDSVHSECVSRTYMSLSAPVSCDIQPRTLQSTAIHIPSSATTHRYHKTKLCDHVPVITSFEPESTDTKTNVQHSRGMELDGWWMNVPFIERNLTSSQ